MEKWLLVGMIAVGLLLGITLSSSLPENQPGNVDLEIPLILGVEAKAQESNDGVNFLEQEAGITAYVNFDEAIDLSGIRDAFKTIEDETDEYIIGEVALSDRPSEAHPHVYVNADGWVVAYYMRGKPTTWIIRWGRTLQENNLAEAIRTVYRSADQEDIGYYHFGHPEATTLMLIEKHAEDSFFLTIPSGLTVYEASWAINSDSGAGSNVHFGDTRLAYQEGIAYGNMTNNLRTNSKQEFRISRSSGHAVVILLY